LYYVCLEELQKAKVKSISLQCEYDFVEDHKPIPVVVNNIFFRYLTASGSLLVEVVVAPSQRHNEKKLMDPLIIQKFLKECCNLKKFFLMRDRTHANIEWGNRYLKKFKHLFVEKNILINF
jgi:hypothetical protein